MMDFMDCDVPSGAAMNGTRAKEESEVNYHLLTIL